ncbi:MAG TPA: D-alanine--D-alanine ligase family protein [Beutenbergiaceae bacterium]|nr:D-alanine--D-alanine ligase family protein [Beutenbergiaceae bacterium]
MNKKLRVAVVFGGASSEHGISCATAAGVLSAIDRDRFDVVPVGITRAGQWVLAADDADRLRLEGADVPEVVASDGAALTIGLGEGAQSLVAVDAANGASRVLGGNQVDVVLPLLHGPFGEDGTIQGLFEMAGVPYVGSGVLSSAVAMDKHYMKVVLESAGLPVGRYEVITAAQWERDPAAAVARAAELSFPVFVKPCRAGSSIGITKVKAREGLKSAIEEAQEHDPKVIIEAGVDGREIEIAVLGSQTGPARTTLPGEIVVGGDHEFYTYEAKYFDEDAADLVWPAELPEETAARARDLAVESFEALSCEGLARVDLFYADGGDLLVNEVNTMPGFTPFSMYPLMWQRSGLSYTELITELIDLALARPKGLR